MVQLYTRGGDAVQPPLPQAAGYVIVVVLGLIVAFGTRPLTLLADLILMGLSHDARYKCSEKDSR